MASLEEQNALQSLKVTDSSPSAPPPTLHFIALNQDSGCFAAGLSTGFRIYNLTPFRETFRRTFTRTGGGIAIVEMLFRCNLLALVGGGEHPRYPANKVMIWDDHQNRCIGELSFRQEVKAVRLRRDRVVVALLTRVYVYRFSDLALLDQFNTVQNDKGLLALSPENNYTVLACPSIGKGGVRVELYDARKNIIINAHNTELGAISLNLTGSRLATASEKGTLIRVFDTATGDMLKELRRGSERAEIQSISFNCDNTFVACSSDKGTVHIFSLSDEQGGGGGGDERLGNGRGRGKGKGSGSSSNNSSSNNNNNNSSNMNNDGSGGGNGNGNGNDKNKDDMASPDRSASASASPSAHASHASHASHSSNSANNDNNNSNSNNSNNSNANNNNNNNNSNKKSALGIVNKFLPQNPLGQYFSSEWSYAQVRGIQAPSICAFVPTEPWTIVVIGKDGSFLRANFQEGGEAVRVSYNRFLKSNEEVLNVSGSANSKSGSGIGGGTDFEDDAVLIGKSEE